ncbi:MAG TPA: site-2 protease family protein [Thermoanaerobaculia bacterium]|nr:site-2 protease family protein [Thermoanaerobaculia bacterium]
MGSSFNVADFVTKLAVILFAISFHESAHAWMALKFGDSTAKDLGRISLNPIRHIDPFGSIVLPILLYFSSGLLFGYAKPTPVRLERTKNPRLADLAVSAAGPLSNLLLAIVGVIALIVLQRLSPGERVRESVMGPIVQIAVAFVSLNVGLGVFNLIPIPPLDGSWVLAALIGEPARVFFQQIGRFGFLILLVLSYTGILGRMMNPVMNVIFRLIRAALA